MKRLLPVIAAMIMISSLASGQTISYPDSWDQGGFNLDVQTRAGVSVTYSIEEFTMNDIEIRGEAMKYITLPDVFLFNDEGAPDLPGSGRYIAIPEGATPTLKIVASRTERFRDVSIAPAPRIPWATERGELEYNKDLRIYSSNAFYPAEPVKLSEVTQVRGVDAVILGITPFQYNPVTKELIVYRDLKVEVSFDGGGQFGEDRLRNRWWDPILSDVLLNYASLPDIDYSRRDYSSRSIGFEYLIITPDDPVFISWADTIRRFRNQQGIYTGITTITEVGGNTTTAIENYINNAYNTWDIPPAAVLLLGDYGSMGSTIISPIWDSYCASDHIYADVNGNDDEEEVILARMTARNDAELSVMINKALDYETDPPTNPDFYNHPITALGWQTERWFQICSEVVGGYLKNVKGKDPVRINAVYDGNPSSDPWSTAPNTGTVVNYFGPNGLGYIPASPSELGGWTGGNASQVNAAINSGSYLLQHRDHGYEFGWGEPDYGTSNIPGCQNTDLVFVFSINCLTGKYNYSSECFTEMFHRYTYNGQPSGALGLLAASEVSYSFVNDTYVWGVFDNMYPDFMPANATTPEPRGELPAFGNAAGKFFLKYSSWPYNTDNKEVTYNLFHHHGDAFTCLYSEVPQNLTVIHNPVLLSGLDYFTVQADAGSLIALSVDGELIGVAEGTGTPVNVTITPQFPPAMVDVVVTKQNYYRYHSAIQTIPPNGPYVVNEAYAIHDETGNNNGQVDYGETVTMSLTLKNVGSENAENVTAVISTTDEYTTILQNTATYGTIPSNQSATAEDAFSFSVAGNVPNGHAISLTVDASNGDTTWSSTCTVVAHAPILQYLDFSISDPAGNNNGRLDPGETAQMVVTLKNTGSSDAYDVYGLLTCSDPYITLLSDSAMFGDVAQNGTIEQSFTVSAVIITPSGHEAEFGIEFTGMYGTNATGTMKAVVGQFPILILDLDGNHNSGAQMKTLIDEWRIGSQYETTMPSDLSQFQVIFLSLGTYNQNHVLTASEAAPFVDFLNNGGKMYMEGGDTWYYDQQYTPTPLHAMFKIQGTSDGNSDLGTVKAVNGTFCEGYSYYFLGDNNYIDRINPVSPGYTLFTNLSPAYNVAVAYEGTTYRTIGSSFELGGLVNNATYTKSMLMLKYLQFFGFTPITETPATPSGPTSVCAGETTSQYFTSSVEGATYYVWAIDPPEAGKVIGYDTLVTVEWDPDFSGDVLLNVCGMNQAGLGPVSTDLQVAISELPLAQVSFSTYKICEGDSTAMDITLTGSSPWHLEINFGGYPMQLDLVKPVVETMYLDPTETLEIEVISLTDGNGCVNTDFEPITIDVDPLPETAAVPAGPAEIDCYSVSQSVYSTTGATYAESYSWTLNPSNAGTIPAGTHGTSCQVDWNTAFTGQATVQVAGINDCGESETLAEKTVNVYNSTAVAENEAGVALSVFPNPNEGNFVVNLSSTSQRSASLWICNAQGARVWEKDNVHLLKPASLSVGLGDIPDGVYFLHVKTSQGTASHKLIIKR